MVVGFNVCMLLCEKMISVGARAQTGLIFLLLTHCFAQGHISDSSENILSANTLSP